MGFKPQRQVYKLVFPDGHDLHGLEIRTRGAAVGDLLTLTKAYGVAQAATAAGAAMSATDAREAVEALVALFGRALISWNLDDEDDQPVPADPKGLESLDFAELLAIVMAWAKRVSEVSAPLGLPSTPTGMSTSTLAMVPMMDVPGS
jgi:hypothetical protein